MGKSIVTFKKVINATIHVDNSGDESRAYEISADVNIMDGKAQSFQNGILKEIGTESAYCSFSEAYERPNFSFVAMQEEESQVAALREINAFMAATRDSIPALGLANG